MDNTKKLLTATIGVVSAVTIAAGIGIGVLAGNVSNLKDQVAELEQIQESQNAEMRAEIEFGKANLISATDFEEKLAAAIGAQNQTMQSLVNTAVKNQIEELGVEGLTEEQVNEIIDAAVANCLTEDEIDAIIADLDTGLSKDEVKKLITNSTSGYLTYGQIVNLIEDETYDLRRFLEDKIGEVAGNVSDLEQSTSSYVVNGKDVVIKSAKGLVDWAKDTDNGRNWNGYTVYLEADVDLSGIEWNPVDTTSYFTFDGNGYTISNLSVENHVHGGFFGKTNAIVVKNVVFENASVVNTTDTESWLGVVAGHTQTIFGDNYSEFENIAVLGSIVEGNDKCGGLFGFLNEYDMTMSKITVAETKIGSDKADAAGGVVGRVGAILITVEDLNIDKYTVDNLNGAHTGEVDGKNSRAAAAESADDLNNALTSGGYVVLDKNVTTDETIEMKDGGTLNGNGKTITAATSTVKNEQTGKAPVNPVLSTNGGTIKNISVISQTGVESASVPRALYVPSIKDDIIVEDSYFKSFYAMNINATSETYGLYADNCVFVGWSSYSSIKEAEFTNCTFDGTFDSPYVEDTYGYSIARVRPYANSVFDGCVFQGDVVMDAGKAGLTLVFTNCYVDDVDSELVKLTAANIEDLLVTETSDTVEYIKNCTVIVDGETVNWN